MTPLLRKRHRQIWAVLAAALPVLFIAAITVIPSPQADPQFNNFQPAALPEVLKEVDNEHLTVRYRANRLTGQQQLEIVLKNSQCTPSLLAYLTPDISFAPNEGAFIGSLSSEGVYRYEVGNFFEKQPESYLLLYDQIKSKVVESIKI